MGKKNLKVTHFHRINVLLRRAHICLCLYIGNVVGPQMVKNLLAMQETWV